MGPNRRAQERERAAALAVERAKRAEAERKSVAEALKIVAIWNARQAGGRALWFYPTIGAAVAAGLPWLSYSCPACGQVGSVDLRTLDRHPRASISSLIPSVSCRRCSPNAPFARFANASRSTARASLGCYDGSQRGGNRCRPPRTDARLLRPSLTRGVAQLTGPEQRDRCKRKS
jgi:hypothetical protein